MFINYIRKNKILTSVFIGSIILVFTAVPLMRMWESITIQAPFFAKIGKYEVNFYDYKQRYERLLARSKKNKYPEAYAHKHTWNYILRKQAIKSTLKRTGLYQVTSDEILDHFIGPHMDPRLKEAFTDPKTGVFEEKKMFDWLQQQKGHYAGKQFLKDFQEEIQDDRRRKKFKDFFSGVKQTNADAAHLLNIEQKEAQITYIFIPKDAITPSSLKPISKEEKQKYFREEQKKGRYKREESIDCIYALVKVKESEEDKEAPKKALEELKKPFEKVLVSGDSIRINAFVEKYSEGKEHRIEWKKSQIPAFIRKQLGQEPKVGQVVPPIMTAPGIYTLYGLVNKKKGWFSKNVTYTFAVIQMGVTISDETKQDIEIKTNSFAYKIKTNKITSEEQFRKEAKKDPYKFMITKVDKLTIKKEHAEQVGYKLPYYIIAHWVFNDRKMKKPSEALELDDNRYVVVMPLKKYKKGSMTFKDAEKKVKEDMTTKRQLEAIKKSLIDSNGKLRSFDDIKSNYSHHAVRVDHETVSAANIALAHGGKAPEIIGGILAMQVGDIKIFVSKKGILIVKCISQSKKEVKQTEKSQNMAIRVENSFIKEAQKKVQDRRYRQFHSY